MVIACLQVGNRLCHIAAKGLLGPVLDVLVGHVGLPAVDVPGQFHHKRDFLFGWLDVAHVEHPYLSCPEGVGLGEFGAEESGRQRTEPNPAGRVAMVGQMVVDAGAARPLLFLRIAEIAAVAVLVVAPQQGHVVGHLQSVVVGVKNFFVGTQHLRNVFQGLVDVSPQHVALVVDGLLHQPDALGCRVGAFHGIVVNAAKPQCVGVLVLSIRAHSLLPVLQHGLSVGDVVEVAVDVFCLPFSFVVAQHLLTVRRPHHNGILVGQAGVLWVVVECLCAGMHGWPQVVCLQAEQQFKHLPVGLRPYLACLPVVGRALLLVGLFGPSCPTAEAFVVDENASVLHRRLALAEGRGLDVQRLLACGSHVGPPVPWRNADGFRE